MHWVFDFGGFSQVPLGRRWVFPGDLLFTSANVGQSECLACQTGVLVASAESSPGGLPVQFQDLHKAKHLFKVNRLIRMMCCRRGTRSRLSMFIKSNIRLHIIKGSLVANFRYTNFWVA